MIDEYLSEMQLLNKPVGLLINFGEGDFSKGMITLENRHYQMD